MSQTVRHFPPQLASNDWNVAQEVDMEIDGGLVEEVGNEEEVAEKGVYMKGSCENSILREDKVGGSSAQACG